MNCLVVIDYFENFEVFKVEFVRLDKKAELTTLEINVKLFCFLFLCNFDNTIFMSHY